MKMNERKIGCEWRNAINTRECVDPPKLMMNKWLFFCLRLPHYCFYLLNLIKHFGIACKRSKMTSRHRRKWYRDELQMTINIEMLYSVLCSIFLDFIKLILGHHSWNVVQFWHDRTVAVCVQFSLLLLFAVKFFRIEMFEVTWVGSGWRRILLFSFYCMYDVRRKVTCSRM